MFLKTCYFYGKNTKRNPLHFVKFHASTSATNSAGDVFSEFIHGRNKLSSHRLELLQKDVANRFPWWGNSKIWWGVEQLKRTKIVPFSLILILLIEKTLYIVDSKIVPLSIILALSFEKTLYIIDSILVINQMKSDSFSGYSLCYKRGGLKFEAKIGWFLLWKRK